MSESTPHVKTPARILVAEDSRTQARLLEHMLTRGGYAVTLAGHGQAALEQLAPEPPALVISDIMMPVMDGYELCRRIKSDPALRAIPVMLLTTLSDPTDVIRGLEAGADAFATKPYNEEALLRRVHSILVNRRLRERSPEGEPFGVFFAGKRRAITARSQRTVEFLLYTYEDAVEKNLDLATARDALALSNRDLESYAEQLSEKNSQLLDDLRMARDIQQAFMPREYPSFPPSAGPERSCVKIAHAYQPSATLSGDFFDILPVSDTQAGIFICDVVGHGLRSALVTAIIRGLLEDLAPDAAEPGRFLSELNRGLAAVFTSSDDPVFASAVYSVLDITTGELRCANAGHPTPLHLRRAPGTAAPLRMDSDAPGPALGLISDFRYATTRGQLAVGDVILYFTDGVIETRGSTQEEYGGLRLSQALQSNGALPPRQLLDRVVNDLRLFAAEGGMEDDVCLVAAELTRLQESQPAPSLRQDDHADADVISDLFTG